VKLPIPDAGIQIPDPDDVRERLLWGMRDVPFPQAPINLHPIILPGPVYEELHTAAAAVLDILVRVARDLGRDRSERLAVIGMDASECPLFVDDEEWEWRYAACIARPDGFVTPDGVKLIEYNAGGGVGAAVQTQLLADTFVDGIYAGAPLRAYRPYAARADMFESMCRAEGTSRSVALLGSVMDLVRGVTSTRYFDTEVDYLRRRGFQAEFFEPGDLMAGITGPGGGLRYEVGLRHFTVQEWTEHGLDWSPVGEALDAGCQLVASETSSFLFNKKLLGFASEGRPWMTGEERRVIDRYLPWTRITEDRRVAYEGSEHDLPELVTSRKDRFLLKKATGMKGEQVLMGRDTDDAAWRSAVDEAVRTRDSIVQERVESVRYPVTIRYPDGDVRTESVAPVVGPWVIGGRPGGCLARYFTDGSDGVVSVERHGGAQSIAVAAA
jgi:hypothetical protein